MKKVIVITGGNSGLGKATARLLAAKNTVVILGKNEQEVVKTAQDLKCTGIVCDVTNPIEIKEAISYTVKKHKLIDCFINCAGIWITGKIEDNDPEKIADVVAVNTLGPMLTTNAVVPLLKKQKKGRIINVVSQAGVTVRAERSVYYASKWAMTGFTKCLKDELLPFGIGVAGFYPGFIHTDIFKKGGELNKDFTRAMPVAKTARALASLVDMDEDLLPVMFEIQSMKQI